MTTAKVFCLALHKKSPTLNATFSCAKSIERNVMLATGFWNRGVFSELPAHFVVDAFLIGICVSILSAKPADKTPSL
jgi:hypothetical protein